VVRLRIDLAEGFATSLDFGVMSLALAFQMNGLGSVFQCLAQVVIAAARSFTLVKTPRRGRRSVSSFDQRLLRSN